MMIEIRLSDKQVDLLARILSARLCHPEITPDAESLETLAEIRAILCEAKFLSADEDELLDAPWTANLAQARLDVIESAWTTRKD